MRDDDRTEGAVLLLGLLAAVGSVAWGAWRLQGGETVPVQRAPYVTPWQGITAPAATTIPRTVPTTTVLVETPGRLALTTTQTITVPVSFSPVTVPTISWGLLHSCTIVQGNVFCAALSPSASSSHEHGAIGAQRDDGSVELPGRATEVAAGQDTSCAVVSGVPYCWGWRTQLGAGNGATPRAINVTGVDKVYAGAGGTLCALDITSGDLNQEGSDDPGTLYCWGEGVSGAGLSGRDWSDHAVVLATSPDWDDVAIGARTICTLNGEVALTCYGDLPDGTHSDTGTVLGTNKQYRHIKITTRSIGDVTVCATREDETNVECF